MAIPPGSLQRLYDFSDPACYSGSGFVHNLAQIAYRFPAANVNATFAGSGTSKYFSFNGTNQYIANQDLASVGGPYSTVTIIVWFQTTNTNNGGLVCWGRTSTYVPGIMTNNANFVQSPGLSTGSFSLAGNVTTTTPVDINLWQMVAFTADGTNSRIYLNGVLQSTDTQDGGQWPQQGGSVIGARIVNQTDIGAPFFAGNIAYISQYNQALSGIDILAEYDRLSPRFPNPVITPTRSYAQGFNG